MFKTVIAASAICAALAIDIRMGEAAKLNKPADLERAQALVARRTGGSPGEKSKSKTKSQSKGKAKKQKQDSDPEPEPAPAP